MTEPRRRWTTSEDALLWELYQVQEKAPTGKCQKVNWNEIARHIPGRTNKDCRKRYFNRFTGGLRKGSWAQEEDERLFQLVERYQYRWATIAQKMETRSADQCSKRWHHCLNPELERSPWTDEENALLLAAVNTHGSSWKDIQRCHFPTRSANNIKNQYTILSRKHLHLSHIHPQPCCRPPSQAQPSPLEQGSSYETYNYPSLSSTPQMSGTEYLPQTPESGLGFEFDPAMGDCGYQFQPVYTGAECEMEMEMQVVDPMFGFGDGGYQYQTQQSVCGHYQAQHFAL
ncbi:Homeodomain-like protein [Aspergillus unguis]